MKTLRNLSIAITISLLVSSCSMMGLNKSDSIDLSNWRAESENVASLSILVEDDGIEGSPVPIGDNTLIFESRKNDNYDLWSINLNSRAGLSQLTTYDGEDRLPCVFPDGQRYVFLSDRSETGFYLGQLGKPTVISLVEVRKPSIGTWSAADISPDGKIMLYVSGKYIWTYNFDSKTKTQFIQGTEPSWSPDGSKIFFRKISREIGDKVSTSIWMMNHDGTGQTEIISGNDEYSYDGVKISPDGTKLLYLKRKVTISGPRAAIGNPDIWICKIDGTDHTQITTHPLSDQEAVWLSDKSIVFASDRPQSGNISDRKWDLWKLDLND